MTDKMIFKRKLCLSPADEKTQISLPFFVEEAGEALRVEFSYYPKILEDRDLALRLVKENILRDSPALLTTDCNLDSFLPIKNLITVSLDDPDGYRGCAHRQPNQQQILLSEKTATPGFYQGKIPKGKWILTLSIHALVTKETTCSLSVYLKGGSENL